MFLLSYRFLKNLNNNIISSKFTPPPPTLIPYMYYQYQLPTILSPLQKTNLSPSQLFHFYFFLFCFLPGFLKLVLLLSTTYFLRIIAIETHSCRPIRRLSFSFLFLFQPFLWFKTTNATHSRVTKSPFLLPLATISGYPPSHHQYTTPTFMSRTL